MAHPRIEGGYYIKARSIADSDIMRSPPYVREVWDWILMNANHKDNKSIKRGQIFTTLDYICEGLCWFVGYRKVSYTKDHMKKAMKALKNASMITTNKSTRGFLITVCNYEFYQDPKNYESTSESTNESTTKAPSKHHESPHDKQECKNEKKERKEESKGVATLTPCQEMIDIWNDEFQKVIKPNSNGVQLTKPRGIKLAKQFKESFKDSLHEWRVYCQKIRDSAFLSGGNDRGWTADIDWVLEPKNLTKILEGRYENAEQTRDFHGKPSAHDNVTEGIKLLLSRRAGQQEY
jgi:hypothetical protein